MTESDLDLGDLNDLTPGSYVKISGKWYFVTQCNITMATADYSRAHRKFIKSGPDEIDLRLQPAPWKED